MKFKRSVVLGLSALMLGSSVGDPLGRVYAADLVKGFQTFGTPGFLQMDDWMPQPKKKPTPYPIYHQSPTKQTTANPFVKKNTVVKAVPAKPATAITAQKLPFKTLAVTSEKHLSSTGLKATPVSKPYAEVSHKVIHKVPPKRYKTVKPLPLPKGGEEPVSMVATSSSAPPSILNGLQEMDQKPAANSSARRPVLMKKRATAPSLPSQPLTATGQNDSLVLQSGITAMINEVDLTVGRAKVIDLKIPAERISISDPEIATAVIISPTQIQLIGKRVGVANLLLWDDANSSRHTIIDIAVHRDVSVLTKQIKAVAVILQPATIPPVLLKLPSG